MNNNFNRLIALSWGSIAGTLCLLSTAQPAKALTFVLDFNEPTQANTTDNLLITVGTFDVTQYGFAEAQFDTIANSILDKVESHYHGISTIGEDANSPLPNGKELDIDFEIGTIFTPPTNGDPDFYFMQIGEYVSENNPNIDGISSGTLGIAASSGARNSTGTSPFGNGLAVGSVFTDHISVLVDPSSPDLAATTNAIAGTLSHEIGHSLSLEHVYKESSVTSNGLPPLMGTGALDLPNIDRLQDRSFSFTAFGAAPSGDVPEFEGLQPIIDALDGDQLRDPFAPLAAIPIDAPELNNVSQLMGAVGTRDSVAVPFEFSPGMGLILVGGTWGIASLRKKLSIKD